MKHTTKRRAFAPRPFPIRITPFLKGVANRLYVTAPFRPLSGPVYHTTRAAFCLCRPDGAAFLCLRGLPGLGVVLGGKVGVA